MLCSNNEKCPCKAVKCPRHGKCCECLEHHKEIGNLPACFFSKGFIEEGKERTIENLYFDYIANK